MIITFGEYRGRSVEWLVLKRPDYVKWILDQPTPTWPLAGVKSEVLRLIPIFDAKPILKTCSEHYTLPLSGFTTWKGNPHNLCAVCDLCDPSQQGPVPEELKVIRTYKDALDFIRSGDARRCDYRLAINTIARAKGFPERSSPARIRKFFGEDVEPDAGEAVSQLIR
jgi:hypothetical protein